MKNDNVKSEKNVEERKTLIFYFYPQKKKKKKVSEQERYLYQLICWYM